MEIGERASVSSCNIGRKHRRQIFGREEILHVRRPALPYKKDLARQLAVAAAEGPLREVCNKLLDAVRGFKKYYPIIESLCHPAIEPRHWYELFDEMDVDDPGDIQDILLSQLLSMGVMQHLDKLEEIAAGAQKEYSLRHAMSASVWPCCISRADGGRSEACQTRVNSETSTSRF